MWDDLVTGAIGAVVLVDTERLEQCFDAVDYFEARQIPFVLAVNCFDGVAKHDLDSVREALAVRPEVPVFYTDARNRAATKQALITLVTLAMSRCSRPWRVQGEFLPAAELRRGAPQALRAGPGGELRVTSTVRSARGSRCSDR